MNLFNSLRLRMRRKVPSFFGRRKIGETNSPCSGFDSIRTPFLRSLSISLSIWAISSALKVLFEQNLFNCCEGIFSKSIGMPLTVDRIS